MHSKHKLGHVNPATGYCTYYKGLLPLAHKNIGNAFWRMFNLQDIEKHFHFLTGTLFNQKHAVDLRPQPVFNVPSVITQTVPYTFYQVVNTRLSLV